jgi:hypothetical protein
MLTWVDIGPCYIHNRANLSWHSIESPFYLIRDGFFNFFFTEDKTTGSSYMGSDTFCGGWDIDNRLFVDDGVAAEILELDGTYLFSRFAVYVMQDTNRYVFRFDPLEFNGNTPQVVYQGRFELDWTVLGGSAFAHQPTFGDNTLERGAGSANHEGMCWIGTNEFFEGPLLAGYPGQTAGEWRTGTAKSHGFTIEGDTLSLLVGGGDLPDSAFVALYDACSDRLLFSATGQNAESMTRRYWDVSTLKGDSVYIKIVDEATGTWGHINVDDIRELPHEGPPGGPFDRPVELHSPNGGEELVEGQYHLIEWQVADTLVVDSLVLHYSIDDGLTYPNRIASVAPSESTFLWEIPPESSDLCRLRVVAYNDSPTCDCDGSDLPFSMSLLYTSVDRREDQALPEVALTSHPNPFNPSTRIQMLVSASVEARVVIFDVHGRAVRVLQDGVLAMGSHRFLWDGRDKAGRPCASGVYIVSAECGGNRTSKKIALIR